MKLFSLIAYVGVGLIWYDVGFITALGVFFVSWGFQVWNLKVD